MRVGGWGLRRPKCAYVGRMEQQCVTGSYEFNRASQIMIVCVRHHKCHRLAASIFASFTKHGVLGTSKRRYDATLFSFK